MTRSRRRAGLRGFTLIELMIVVAIIGILAAVAIPTLVLYIRRTKTTEPLMNLRKMYDSSISYYASELAKREGTEIVARQFPQTQAATPDEDSCCGQAGDKCVPDPSAWGDQTWAALNFAVDDAHYFWYSYDSTGTDETSRFTARSNGNLDCDTSFSTYERVGIVDGSHNVVQGGAAIFIKDDIE